MPSRASGHSSSDTVVCLALSKWSRRPSFQSAQQPAARAEVQALHVWPKLRSDKGAAWTHLIGPPPLWASKSVVAGLHSGDVLERQLIVDTLQGSCKFCSHRVSHGRLTYDYLLYS